MKAYMPEKLFFINFILLITFCQSDNHKNITSKGKCIFMIDDSSAYNFHYIKSGEEQNK